MTKTNMIKMSQMIKASKTNNRKAWEYFVSHGYQKKGNVLHHKDITLKEKNPIRYHQWKPSDLIVLSKQEHRRLHMRIEQSGKKNSRKHNKHISEGMKNTLFHRGDMIKITLSETAYFRTMTEAANYIGCSRQMISQCLRPQTSNIRALGYKVEIVSGDEKKGGK